MRLMVERDKPRLGYVRGEPSSFALAGAVATPLDLSRLSRSGVVTPWSSAAGGSSQSPDGIASARETARKPRFVHLFSRG